MTINVTHDKLNNSNTLHIMNMVTNSKHDRVTSEKEIEFDNINVVQVF